MKIDTMGWDMDRKINNETVWLSILILIAIDQIIKIIVKNYYGVKVPIIKNLIYFKPTLNEDYSWINAIFNFGWSRLFHIAYVLIALFIFYYAFKYIYFKAGKRTEVRVLEVFLVSGALCSLIDKIFWDGSLDYIFLNGLFVFDLKDCYITTSEVLALILITKNWTSISKISSIELIKDYIGFIRKNFSKRSLG